MPCFCSLQSQLYVDETAKSHHMIPVVRRDILRFLCSRIINTYVVTWP